MAEFHQFWGWVSVVVCGLVGLWGLLAARRRQTPRWFMSAVVAATGVVVVQIALGVLVQSSGSVDPGSQHTFYGYVIAFVLAFTYIYRAQFGQRPAFSYGLLLLFVMGLGLRGIATFGVNF